MEPIAMRAPERRDVVQDVTEYTDVPERSPSVLEAIYNIDSVRRGVILLLLALAWESYGCWLNNPLIFPTLG
jgi:NitT/TauT family transport system permease protein